MKRIAIAIIVIFFAVLGAGKALASECIVVGGAAGLGTALSQARGGGCTTDSATYRDRYGEYFPGATQFNVVKWIAPDVISGDLPAIENTSDKPLVIIAGPAVEVKFTGGANGIVIRGNNIVLDNVTVEGSSGNGIVIQGERDVVIDSSIMSNGKNGILVTGKDARIVDSEIASNSWNGIFIGGGSAGQSCSGVARSDTGKGAVVAGSNIHDNGGSVNGSNCADTTDANSIGPCWSLKLETESCFDLLKSEPACDEPSVPMNDSCGHSWNARYRCEDLFAKAAIAEDQSMEDAVKSVYGIYAGAQGGAGVVVDADGAQIRSSGSSGTKNRIYGNATADVYVNSLSPAAICQDVSASYNVNLIQTALISETPVGNLVVSRFPLPAITQLAASGNGSNITLTGNVLLPTDSWNPWNQTTVSMAALRADIYVQNGSEIVFAGKADVDTSGRFSVNISNTASDPTFIAALVDTEHGNTSAFTGSRSATPSGDDDGDGLPNDQEDVNHNGRVDPGETDPINPDTDGDGLTDGEEKLHDGRVAGLVAANYPFADLGRLNALNPDSDGDCLPDGLELGVSKEEAESLIRRMPAKPHYEVSAPCRAILTSHTVTSLQNAILYDTTLQPTADNIVMLFDEDPKTITDPTSVDTDTDGMRDGNEDFNFNGKQDASTDGNGWLESDPTLSDSDADGIPDGEEGDKDGDGVLGPDESDPHNPDTDGDGVKDGQEIRIGTYPNACDSDEDGLSDGVETGAIKPAAAGGSCHGLEAAGTNYKNPHMMDPLNPDSDSDGLMDGEEDMNGNGWIESQESDPSVQDSDRDGLDDGVEARGDFDGDKIPDFDIRLITAGPKCSPPPDISDVDCDGIPNAIDVDSDDDGCPDADEGGWKDINVNSIPDVYDNEAKGCGAGEGGGGIGGVIGGGGGSPSENPAGEGGRLLETPAWLTDQSGGGACQLSSDISSSASTKALTMIGYLIVLQGILLFRYFNRK